MTGLMAEWPGRWIGAAEAAAAATAAAAAKMQQPGGRQNDHGGWPPHGSSAAISCSRWILDAYIAVEQQQFGLGCCRGRSCCQASPQAVQCFQAIAQEGQDFMDTELSHVALMAHLDDTHFLDVDNDFLEEWKTINSGYIADDSDIEPRLPCASDAPEPPKRRCISLMRDGSASDQQPDPIDADAAGQPDSTPLDSAAMSCMLSSMSCLCFLPTCVSCTRHPAPTTSCRLSSQGSLPAVLDHERACAQCSCFAAGCTTCNPVVDAGDSSTTSSRTCGAAAFHRATHHFDSTPLDSAAAGQPDKESVLPRVICKSRASKAAEVLGLSTADIKFLVAMRAPLILWQCLWFMKMTMGVVCRDLLCLDAFAGLGHVAAQWTRENMCACTYEILDDMENENILSPRGFLRLLLLCMRLARGGMAHWGTVCSSWVWICRGTSKRSSFNWAGDTSRTFVAEGNSMVSRMTVCLILISMRCGDWILEQPATSLMHMHERFDGFVKRLDDLKSKGARGGVKRCYMWMGGHGAATAKPTVLRGTVPWLSLLKAPLNRAALKATAASTPQVVRELEPHSDGRRRVTGEKDTLKATQEYPVGYAQAIFKHWRFHVSREEQAIESSDEEDASDVEFEFQPWHEGHFEADAAFIGLHPNELPAGLGTR